MKRKIYVMLCVLSMALVACGNGKKLDTGKFETAKEKNEIPAEVEDGYVTVYDTTAYVDKDGKEYMYYTYKYDEEGRYLGEVNGTIPIYQNAPSEAVAVYSEAGEYLGIQEKNDYERNGSRYVTDSSGRTLYIGEGVSYTMDSNGYFETIKRSNSTERYIYENGLLVKTIDDSQIEDYKYTYTVDYTYAGGTLIKQYSEQKRGDIVERTSLMTFDGDSYTNHSVGYDSQGEVKSIFEDIVDERGVTTYYKSLYDSEDVELSGDYNENKTLYTMMKPDSHSMVCGYQVEFTEDGRVIKAYKIDKEGKPVSDDLMIECFYDEKGHLTEMIEKNYKAVYYDNDEQAETFHHYFRRVPKEYNTGGSGVKPATKVPFSWLGNE